MSTEHGSPVDNPAGSVDNHRPLEAAGGAGRQLLAEELDAAGVLLDDEADEDVEEDDAEELDDVSDDFDSLLAPEPFADPEEAGVDELFDDRLSFR